jgi:hypothetical protein
MSLMMVQIVTTVGDIRTERNLDLSIRKRMRLISHPKLLLLLCQSLLPLLQLVRFGDGLLLTSRVMVQYCPWAKYMKFW